MECINLSHGNGGQETEKIIENIFYKHFGNSILLEKNDASIVNLNGKLAVTTDSFVVNPIFFPGGDIGKLSVCGTINDLVVSGSTPVYITVGFIIEEGFSLVGLEKICYSIGKEARENNVQIVAGDTKVVERGKGDKIYINTTGIGVLQNKNLSYKNIEEGDKIIVSGSIADHGTCMLNEREEFFKLGDIKSDCCSLYPLTKEILNSNCNIKFMRDPTRGGVGKVLNEIADLSNKLISISEENFTLRPKVKSLCKMLGINPLHIANEGKVIIVVSNKDSKKLLKILKNTEIGRDSSIVGEVKNGSGVVLTTFIGGEKKLPRFKEDIIPGIC